VHVIYGLLFVMDAHCVLFKVGVEFLYVIEIN